jgi:hypothetical protein
VNKGWNVVVVTFERRNGGKETLNDDVKRIEKKLINTKEKERVSEMVKN